MDAIIRIKESNGKKAVSARELYEYLEVKTSFTHWCNRMFEYGFEQERDFMPILTESNGGRPSTDYALAIDCAKEISMLQRTEKGKQARLYFIECEKQAVQLAPTNFKEALMLALRLEEEKEQLALKVSEQAPMVKAFERVIDNAATYTLDTVSDILNIGRNKLSETLKSLDWAMKDSTKGTASTRYAELQRYAKTIFDTAIVKGKEIPTKKIVITRRGLDKLITIYNQ